MAEGMDRQALNAREATLGEDHPDTRATVHILAEMLR